MELHMTTIAAFQAKLDHRTLASLKRDLAWLRTRINAGTDPTVQKYIAETKARIAAAAKRRGRP
jgi:hypothetical protein